MEEYKFLSDLLESYNFLRDIIELYIYLLGVQINPFPFFFYDQNFWPNSNYLVPFLEEFPILRHSRLLFAFLA